MTSSYETAERRKLTSLARELRKSGYSVMLHPETDALPAFLHGFRPDMVAIGKSENIVIAVRSRQSLSDPNDNLKELADAVSSQPDWRLDLVVTNPREHTSGLISGMEPDVQEIQSRIGAAREMLDEGQGELAALIAWSAAEAVLRRVAQSHDVTLERLQPDVVLKQLYFVGLLGDDDFDVLRAALKERNYIAHGFRARVSPDEWIRPLIHTTSDLLAEAID